MEPSGPFIVILADTKVPGRRWHSGRHRSAQTHRRYCLVTSVSLRCELHSAFCWLCGEDEVKRLRGQQDEIYEGRDAFKELLVDVKEVIEIPNAASDIYVAHAEQVSEVAGPSATETTPPESLDEADNDVEGVVPEEGASDEDAG
ncbi:hypothetical protein AALP_AA3G312900 [Arabis alpina]|uniref:Uncharacterized protein n=1 Tax=Arabis alpina TaxID=50452 RepID=A0A087HCW8_ARAAL|nr:hypothetical protein AALP_AA3G312900 [Arabis alpina]